MSQILMEKIANKEVRLAVIGMGYVGLPLMVEMAEAGFQVTGIDVAADKVEKIHNGESYIQDVPTTRLRPLVRQGRIGATTDFSILRECDCVSICVPTPLRKTKDPDISYIVAAVKEIKKYVHPNMLIVLESTTYPGTTDEILLPDFEAAGFTVGKDFFLAFSPERVDPGNKKYTTRTTPKIIGGVTERCTTVAKRLYESFIDTVVPVSSTKAAEMVKLLENTFRSVNIGLVNEIALMCDRLNINVWEVIRAAATKPFGFMPFYPGPGLGGHCIPIDPVFLSWKLKTLNYTARFIELASEINANMPRYVVQKATEALNLQKKAVNGARILIIGVSYKKDIDDVRESPALDVIKLLEEKGAEIMYYDPFVASLETNGKSYQSLKSLDDELGNANCVIICTDHSQIDYDSIVRHSQVVVDTRNATADLDHLGNIIRI